MVTRYKPQWKKTGSTKWQGFPNSYSFGSKSKATAFVKRTRNRFKNIGRKGRFRIKTDRIKI